MSKNKKNNKTSYQISEKYTYIDAIVDSFKYLGIYLILQFITTVIVSFLLKILGSIKDAIVLGTTINSLTIKYHFYSVFSELQTGEQSLVSLLCAYISILIVFFFIMRKRKDTKEFKPITSYIGVWTLSIGIVINIVFSFLVNIIVSITTNTNNVLPNEQIGNILNSNFVLALIIIGILAPISEELVFRYGVFKAFERINPIVGIIVSSLIFGIIHMNPIQSSYAFAIGLIFAIIYYKTKNLFYPVLLHIGINVSSTIVSTQFENEYLGLLVCLLVFGGIGLFAYLISILIKKCNK